MFKSIAFEVIGNQRLHCESCEQRVERLLKAVEGVGKVRAQARNQRIEILFDPAALEATAIAERLATAGYETRVQQGPSMREALTKVDRHQESAHPDVLSRGINWLRALAQIPSAVLPLLPSATCPVCAAAYAGVLSALGLGFVFRERVLASLIVSFLIIGIVSVIWSSRSHRRPGPLLLTLSGSAAVVIGRLVWSVPVVLYAGVALLIGASVWNLWLRRPRAQRLVQIQGGSNK